MSSYLTDQIRERQRLDDDYFENTMKNMGDALSGKNKKYVPAYDENLEDSKDAIEAILKYYRVTPRELPENVKGLYPQLEYLLRPAGVMWREVKLTGSWVKEASGAMLCSDKDGTMLALLPRPMGGYDMFNPAEGSRTKVTSRNVQSISEDALAFYRPLPNRSLDKRDMLGYMSKTISLSDYGFLIAVTLLATLIGLIPAHANRILFTYVAGVDSSLIPAALTMLLGAAIATFLINASKSLCTSRLGAKMGVASEAAVMARLLSLPVTFFSKYASGDLAARVGGIGVLCESITEVVLSTGLMSLFSIIFIVQIYVIAPAMALPSLLIALATVGFSLLSSYLHINHIKKRMIVENEISGFQYALLLGIQKIRLTGSEKRCFAKWAEKYAGEVQIAYNPPTLVRLSEVFNLLITSLGTVVIYIMAAASEMTPSVFMSFNVSFGMMAGSLLLFTGVANTVALIDPTLEMILPILKEVPESSDDKEVVTSLNGSIELNNVSFRYNTEEPFLLKDITLKIRPDQYVAIVGRTGCGKSTMMKLLLGFEQPEKGAIYFDGRDLRSLDARSVRRHMGMVMQDGKLFQGTVFDNIAISKADLSMDEAWEAAELSGLADDIKEMPMGMFTMISEDSGGISGGQRQRMLIARAIAPKPKILMFDEATSALDNITQKTVSDSLDALKCTRLVIAHRLSTIRQCNRILVLDDGKIIEDGTYDELLAQNGVFSELVARQRLDDTGYVSATTAF